MASQSGYLNPDVIRSDFSGGRVNVPQVRDAAQLRPGQSPLMRNVDTSGRSIRKMRGFSKVTPDAVAGDISSIHYDEYTGDIFVGYSDKLGKLSGDGIAQLSDDTDGYTASAIWSFSRLNDYLLCVNGADAPVLWNSDTSTASAITSAPSTWESGNYPEAGSSWMGRLFAWVGDDILYYSKLYDPNTWTTGTTATDGGALRIGDDGIPITACWPLANGLLIFKDPGLYYLAGSFDSSGNFDQTKFDWTLLSKDVDARSFRAIVGMEDSVFAWGREKVWRLQGTDVLQRIATKAISDYIAHDVAQVPDALSRQICATHYPERNQVWFGVAKNSGSTKIDTIHCYDYASEKTDGTSTKAVGQWFLRDGYSHKCMANVRDDNGKLHIYSGGYDGNGYIFQQNSTVDYDAAAMPCQYYTDWMELGAVARGRPGIVILTLGQQTRRPLSYSYAYDYATADYYRTTLTAPASESVWNSSGGSTWGTSSANHGTYQAGRGAEVTCLLYGYGRRIQHRFYSNTKGADFAILAVKHPSTSIGYR